MIVIADQADLDCIAHPGIKQLIAIRLEQVAALGDSDVSQAYLIVVENGDNASKIEEVVGLPILTGLFDDLPFDHPDFYPNHEILEEHHHEQFRFYEMVFIGNDDGAATALFFPDEEGIDANLLALCRSFATVSQP